MVNAATAAKAASGVAQAKPSVKATLDAASKTIQTGLRQPTCVAADCEFIGVAFSALRLSWFEKFGGGH
jgi:hypothetical protein